jgi:hypothetical protein
MADIVIFNAQTGETVERNFTPEELEEYNLIIELAEDPTGKSW